jgi:hypothetical protein
VTRVVLRRHSATLTNCGKFKTVFSCASKRPKNALPTVTKFLLWMDPFHSFVSHRRLELRGRRGICGAVFRRVRTTRPIFLRRIPESLCERSAEAEVISACN